jgi:hypothetical protein
MAEIEEVCFGDPLVLARITLRELKSFYDEGTKHFEAELARLEMRSKNTSREDDESDYLSDMMGELEALLDLLQEFGILGIYRTLEVFLQKVADRLSKDGVLISTRLDRPKDRGKVFLRRVASCLRRKGEGIPGQTARLDQLKDRFKEVGVELTQPPFQWREITKLRKIRNCIAHNEGWVDRKQAPILKSYQLRVEEGNRLKLPKGYFLEALRLVEETCELVTDKRKETREQGG